MGSFSVVHVVGARPQFVKAAIVLEATGGRWRNVLVHTGQHYDHQLSEVFFQELGIPRPDVNLEVGSGSHAVQTGAMMVAFEAFLAQRDAGIVVVYGDTNSTLAAALVASKYRWPVVHVEAGLRSFDRSMPEEINRIAVDHISDLLLCPTERALEQLHVEGLADRAVFTGDVMFDLALKNRVRAQRESVLGRLINGGPQSDPSDIGADCSKVLSEGRYVLATLHRAANTDDPSRLERLIKTLGSLSLPVIMPLHPRTRAAMSKASIEPSGGLHCIGPVGYLDFAALLGNADHVITDSGGVQKEAIFHDRPCTTLRDTTEWPETMVNDWNVLVDAEPELIRAAVGRAHPGGAAPTAAFGSGTAAVAVCDAIATLSEGLYSPREMHTGEDNGI
jgi:UDP-GlcNAc3NAcA epimerase